MKKQSKKKADAAPTFYDFRDAAVCDTARADQMLQEDPNWVRACSSPGEVGETALHYLAIENYVAAARYLLTRGADVEGADENSTPLVDAARLGNRDMVALLIEHGANLEAQDLIREQTALLAAAENGYTEICDLLLTAGADMSVRDYTGLPILEIALPRKREQILAVLLRHGYNPPE